MREFVILFADKGTIARMESDELARNPNTKSYSSFKEFMDEMELESD